MELSAARILPRIGKSETIVPRCAPWAEGAAFMKNGIHARRDAVGEPGEVAVSSRSAGTTVAYAVVG
jgi:hypothetical protein